MQIYNDFVIPPKWGHHIYQAFHKVTFILTRRVLTKTTILILMKTNAILFSVVLLAMSFSAKATIHTVNNANPSPGQFTNIAAMAAV